MNKINTLLKCLPKSPFTDQLTAEIRELTHQRDQYKANAKKYEWMVINHDKWSWHPSIYNKDIISGFSANGTGYLGYTFSTALKLAMKAKK